MKKQLIGTYVWFGTCLRYLQDAQAGAKIKGGSFITANIDRFLNSLIELGLQVTWRAAQELEVFRGQLDTEKDEDAVLSKEQASHLSNLMYDIRKTLDAEIQGFEAFVVTPKIFDTGRLLNNVASLFAPNVFSALPHIAQYDLSEAGKCIAFERPTAAAFHILRSTEEVLRLFYCTLIRQKRVSPLLWGNMVNDLRNRQKTKKHETLYSNLDNIRFSFRNPTQHPEKIYDIHEVQDLWALCVEVINRMMRILKAA